MGSVDKHRQPASAFFRVPKLDCLILHEGDAAISSYAGGELTANAHPISWWSSMFLSRQRRSSIYSYPSADDGSILDARRAGK